MRKVWCSFRNTNVPVFIAGGDPDDGTVLVLPVVLTSVPEPPQSHWETEIMLHTLHSQQDGDRDANIPNVPRRPKHRRS